MRGVRKGYVILTDAVVGIILFTAFLGLLFLLAFKLEHFVYLRQLSTANTVLASKLAQLQGVCKTTPDYSNTETVTLGKDTFTVDESCSPVSGSLTHVEVEVEGKGVDVKGESYVSQ